ncbi:MAG: SDR family oxidoreductase [Gammaproteobacteria bacterium]
MELADKIIVITGAGRGLGRAMAQALAVQRARLALVDLDEAALLESVRCCENAGGEARPYLADVAEEQAVEALFNRVIEDFGAVDALINNAGITHDGLLVKTENGSVVKKMSLEQWQSVLRVNLTGVFLCGREAAVRIIEGNHPGVIVNMCSISRAGNIGQSNYAAAKSGVSALTVTWAKELVRYGIRVVAIAPGFCDTPMVAGMPEKARVRLKEMIPMGRFAKPAEIARSLLYVLQNDYFNGRVLEVDGGLRF